MAESESLNTLSLDGVIGEQQTDKRRDAKIANELTILFNGFDRLVTMMRVYPKGHPILDEIATTLAKRVRETVQSHGELEVNLGARELKSEGGTVFFSAEIAEKKQFIYYSAYADGIVRVTLHDDVTSKELQDFLGVINRADQGAIGSDDDTVTLLWELNLQAISYAAVEGFVDSGSLEAFGDINEADATALVADATQEPRGEAAGKLQQLFNNLNLVHMDLFTRMQIESHQKMSVPALSERDLAYAFGVDDEVIRKLLREWSSGVDLEYRLIEALLSIIRTSPQSDDGQRASALITEVMHNLLDKEMYAQAARVLELLHDRRELFSKVDYDPVGDLIDELSDPLRLEALVYTMQVNASQRADIKDLLMMLGPTKVQRQVLLLLADGKRKVVAIPQLVDLVVATLLPENESQMLAADLVKSPDYFKRLLPVLADRDPEGFKPMPRLIRAALQIQDEDVLRAALGIEHPVWADGVLADKYLQPMSTSQNEDVRKLALKRLGEHHSERFKAAIRESVLARKFTGRTHAELRFLMRIFVESDAGAAEALRTLLQTRGWLNAAHREFAKMAGAVLIECGDVEATAFIEKRAASIWTHPDLKASWTQSLQRFQTKALPAPEARSGAEDGPADRRFVKPDENGVFWVDGVPDHAIEDGDEALTGLGSPSESWDDAPGLENISESK